MWRRSVRGPPVAQRRGALACRPVGAIRSITEQVYRYYVEAIFVIGPDAREQKLSVRHLQLPFWAAYPCFPM